MSNGQHPMIAGNFSILGQHAGQAAILLRNADDLGVEPHFAAQRDDPLTDVLHHSQKHIGSHMGLGVKEDIFPRARLYHLLQHPANAHIADAGVQLAVREGTGTALAELHIAAAVQLTGGKEFLHLLVPALGILAPLQNNGS